MVEVNPKTQRTMSRLAGFMYLFGIVAFMGGDQLLSGIHSSGDFAATAGTMASREQTVRAALLLMLATSWGTVLLARALYALLKPAGSTLALFALLWRSIEAALGALSCLFRFVGLENYKSAAHGDSVAVHQILGLMIRNGSSITFNIADLFFAAGSTAFFVLFYRSRLMPRVLSVLGVTASLIVGVFGIATLMTSSLPSQAGFAWLPIFAAELGTGFWLLFFGVKLMPGPVISRGGE